MMEASPVIAFILAALAIEATPGPNMGYLAIISASKGFKAGMAAVAGVALGLFILGLIAAFGMTEIIRDYPVLSSALQWVGVLYILYLAWDSWKAEPTIDKPETLSFRRGLTTNLLNPKALLFFSAVLPGFASPDHDYLEQSLFLLILYVIIATIVHSGIVYASSMSSRFMTSQKHHKSVARIMALMLLIIAVWMALSAI